MKKNTIIISISAFLAICLCISLCVALTTCKSNNEDEGSQSSLETTPNGEIIYTDKDGNKHKVSFDDGSQGATEIPLPDVKIAQSPIPGTYQGTVDACITLTGSTATVDGSGVQVDYNKVTFTSEGTYLLSGELEGQIIVDTPDTEKVKLILNGVSVSCADGPALLVNTAAKKVILYSAKSSVNLFSDGTDYYAEAEDGSSAGMPNACIWSAEDLKFDGEGEIYITGNCDKGVNSKDDLEITGGKIYVNAIGAGMRGNDSVSVEGGYVYVCSSAGDGIKMSNTEDGKATFTISGGEVYVDCFGDAISSASSLSVLGGSISVKTHGTLAQAAILSDRSADRPDGGPGGGGPGGGGPGGMNEGNPNKSSTSAKGLKSAGLLLITGGNITVNCTDDAIHSDSAVQIDKGNLYLSAADDGIHGEQSAMINGGVIEIAKSYEGIEAVEITVNGGTIRLVSSDDGFNACGGTSMMGGPGGGFFAPEQSADTSSVDSDQTPLLTFNGGYTIVNASGDGIDSNAQIVITGGTVIVYGPTNNGNGPIDHGDARTDQLTISGGTLLAIGSSGMANTAIGQDFGVIAFATRSSFPADTTMGIFDADKNLIFAFKSPKAFASVVFSSASVKSGEQYIVGFDGTISGSLQDGICKDGTYTDYTELGEIQAE